MKFKLVIIASLLLGIFVTGCTKSNVNDNVAYRNRNGMEPTRVNYNPRNTGPAVTNPNATDVRYNNRDGNFVGNNQSRMRVADHAAKRVTDLREVDSANVIVTDNNAYVAAKLANNAGTKLTQKIKKKISNRVKSVDPSINNVYISVNPDFYHRMTGYAKDIRSGRPVSGLFNEFSNTVQRIFPNLKQ
ncbi:MAG: YhcN/YlaJ family sporulation lipoprotein [Bacillota bacterium]|nr:YhcN/YlaJ family sporulation lipoprotein [Bacillota bacterium]